MRPEEHLARLVAIDSSSNKPNAPVIDYLQRAVEAAGFQVRRQGYRDAAGIEKQNLVAVRNARPDGSVAMALVGHTDCVPFDPDWSEALQLTERDGKLFARGSADTKGFIASALCAVEALAAEPMSGGLALIFTADEEVGCVGAKRLAAAADHPRPRVAIVGEPTSLRPVYAHKGYCVAEVVLRGAEAHSAYPSLGISAIRGAGLFLGRLAALDAELATQVEEGFQPPFTTTNVGLIRGGTAKNIIPAECRLTVEWRPIPSQEPQVVADKLQEIRRRVCDEMPGLEVGLDVRRLDKGLSSSKSSELIDALRQEGAGEPTTVAFGTEGPELASMGAEAVVFGPGDIGVAHRTGEFVPRDELQRSVQILHRVVQRFAR